MRKTLFFTVILLSALAPRTLHSQVTQEWVRKFVGLGLDKAADIAADNFGNVYIVGNNNWGTNNSDIYLVRYNSSGLQTGGFLYNSPNADIAVAVTTDANGNVYVAGRVVTNNSTSDIVLMKFNSSMTQQWVTIYNTPENYAEDVNAMKVDAAGNIYLTGSIVKGPFEYDYLTVKFNSDGTEAWHAYYNGTANSIDIANDISVDATGNVFITGQSMGVLRRVILNIPTYYDAVTIKYNPTGVQQWVQRYNRSNRQDVGNAISMDMAGNVFVAGYASSTSNADALTLKYTNDGIFQWVQLYNGSANLLDEATSVAIDAAGDVIVAGSTNGGIGGSSDVLAIKYQTTGVSQWVGTYSVATNTVERGVAMKLDQFGNAYVTGETLVPGVVNSDFLTVKFNSTGGLAWAARYNGPENGTDAATSLTVVNNSRIGSLTLATVYVYGISSNDVVTIKYSQPFIIEPPILLAPQPNSSRENSVGVFRSYNYPNPVRTYTNISCHLPVKGDLTITLFDALGKKISNIVEGNFDAGVVARKLDASHLAKGEYYYRCVFKAGGKEFLETKKIIIQW